MGRHASPSFLAKPMQTLEEGSKSTQQEKEAVEELNTSDRKSA